MTILLIGAGRMGSALLKGWVKNGIKSIAVIEPAPSGELYRLAKRGRIKLAPDLAHVKGKPKVCVVAIKPQVLKSEAAALADYAQSGALMISIAAGTSIKNLTRAWGKGARIIRAMPNTPGAVGEGITGLYAAKGVTKADSKRATSLLAALGETVWVAREELIDTVTAISGSGPAYLFLMAEALTEAGVAEGLSRAQAETFARATVAGAGALLKADPSPAAALRAAVTSPGGTTAAALSVLMADDGLVALIRRAVHAARKRAEELR